MVDFEEMKQKHPRVMLVLRGLAMVLIATILALVLISPLYIFEVDGQILFDIFTFPADIIPRPYNLVGIFLIPSGLLLVVWANYTLLHIGKISLGAREPMQIPSTLIVVGPYRYSRNPIYLAVLMMIFGLVIVWSSLVVLLGLIVVYLVFRYVFIKREEIILEDAFGDEYLNFKKCIRRWF